ncbi:MAG TPA: beta-L-arabinofuranosidase domain-containing protein, partial [Levilinea sp.]|nr:beta-L-arabinofuranosidase domain-containing protein [Levilinea sp.]
KPANSMVRWYASALSGKYFQQHAPVRRQTVPVGHSVRFAYLETAVTMLALASGDRSLLPALESAWERMVTRRMYITGGTGSLPGTEGYGNDYELDPEFAYAETCASLASLFWNWQMVQLTGEAKYTDLFEWQLYNAAGVGMGFDGRSYLYNNPLTCHGGVERKPWYAVPCCPSNISRTWADLGRYIATSQDKSIRIHQFISSQLSASITAAGGEAAHASLAMEADLPWEGRVRIKVTDIETAQREQPLPFLLEFRQPAWVNEMPVTVNGEPVMMPATPAGIQPVGYDPRPASYRTISRSWAIGDQVEITFPVKIVLRRAHPRVKAHEGKVAVTRGPLVYCLESVDNPGVDLFTEKLDLESLAATFDSELLGGMVRITAKTTSGKPLTLIPYFAWGNRGPSQMTVWVNIGSGQPGE